jgi:hypothetical protein
MSDYFDKKCKTCRHWQKQSRPALPNGAVDMSLPVVGMCRRHPPVVTLFPQQNGQMIMKLDYPMMQDDWPACGEHGEKVRPPVLMRGD